MLDREHWHECCPQLMVPYGRWTCATGREVLFNRRYWPILTRHAVSDRLPYLADPGWWVNYNKQEFFWNDGNTPWRRGGTRALRLANDILGDWLLPSIPMKALHCRPRAQALEYDQMTIGYAGRLSQDLSVEHRKAPWAFWFPGSLPYREPTESAS